MILFACAIAFTATYLIGNIYAMRMAQDLGTERLTSQTRLLAPQFQNAFNKMQRDTLTISNMPDIAGIERARLNGGVDPVEGSTSAIWRQRLAMVFMEQMAARPYYLQMRFIGVENDGTEIVRVNATRSRGLVIVPDKDLKPHASEAYYQEAIKTGNSPDDVYFSAVRLNRENDVVEIPYRPIIRAIRTVRNEAGVPIGMVMISADYYELIRATMAGNLTNAEIYIINSEGDYMMQDASGKISPFYYRSDDRAPLPEIIKLIRPITEAEKTFFVGRGDNRKVVHYIRLLFDPGAPDRFMGIAMASPQHQVFVTSPAIQRDTLTFSIGFALIACVLAFYVARMFIQPLEQMNREIMAYGDGKRGLDLPTHLQDEIGAMANALKDMTAKLDLYYAELERSNRELDDFAYIASHDLKEPLRAISNHTTFLYEDHVKDMNDDAKSRVDRIKKLCERAEKLVSELLYFSRLGRGEMAKSTIEVLEIVDDIKSGLAAVLEEHRAVITVDTHLPAINCDSSRIMSVFHNLILNGIKYNDSNPKTIHVGHLPKVEHQGRILHDVFYVRDNGIGIAPEYHEHVFRLFKRLNSQHKYGEGTGAGLTFVKKIIERHHGKIWLVSTPGQGSTFYFTLAKERT